MVVDFMIDGFAHFPRFLALAAQRELLESLDRLLHEAPFFTPVMPRTGRPFSVRMTNLGTLGWLSDRRGYRYEPLHPETGKPWPAMPQQLLAIWRELSHYPHDPEACLVNHYRQGAKMGLHRDEDEEDFSAPVISISLGATAVFRLGGLERKGKTATIELSSGDVVVMGGASRLRYHGIDSIVPGTSRLPSLGGRINLTLRRVRKPRDQASFAGAFDTPTSAGRKHRLPIT